MSKVKASAAKDKEFFFIPYLTQLDNNPDGQLYRSGSDCLYMVAINKHWFSINSEAARKLEQHFKLNQVTCSQSYINEYLTANPDTIKARIIGLNATTSSIKLELTFQNTFEVEKSDPKEYEAIETYGTF